MVSTHGKYNVRCIKRILEQYVCKQQVPFRVALVPFRFWGKIVPFRFLLHLHDYLMNNCVTIFVR